MRFLPRFFYDDNASGNGGGSGTEKTQEAIDKENEVKARLLGSEPLQTETTPVKTNNTESPADTEAARIEADAQKLVLARAAQIEQEQEAERERLRLEQIQKDNPAESVVKITKIAPVVKLDEPPAKTDDEIEEEKVLAILSKKAGKQITSLDEVLNPKKVETIEEPVLSEQERENAMVAFALQNKKISKKEIESFITDTKDLQSVAYNFFAENLKELEPDLTDKQIMARFEEKYAINEDEDSKEFKMGQREMNFVANTLINQKHAKYIGLNTEYSSFEQAQLAEKARQASILQKTPQFKRDVEEVTQRLRKFKLGGHDIEFGDDIIQEYKDEVFASAHSEKIIEKGYSLDGLEKAFRDRMLLDNIDSIFDKVLDADRLKNQAGTRGIIPPKNQQKQKVYTDQQVKQEEELQKRLQNANAGALN